MKLTGFQIKNYEVIDDMEPMKVGPKITALVRWLVWPHNPKVAGSNLLATINLSPIDRNREIGTLSGGNP